jgi:uncharacterized protein (UPF0332 family)
VTERTTRLLAKARRSLDSARRSARDGDSDFAVSRAYYAMFYAAAALLMTRGRTFTRHSGLVAAFNQEFVRSGEIESIHFQALDAAFRARNIADYGYDDTISPEAAERVLRDAGSFVAAPEVKLGSAPPG